MNRRVDPSAYVGKTINGGIKIIGVSRSAKNNKTCLDAICPFCNKKFSRESHLFLVTKRRSCGCRESVTKENNNSWSGCGEIYGQYFNSIQCRARRKNFKFNLTIEYLWQLFLSQNKKCVYSGETLKFYGRKFSGKTTASLDRINSSKGYEIGNVQWIHKDINKMKNVYSENYFFELVKKIYEHKKL